MSWFSEALMGSKPSTQQYSTLSASQQPVEGALGSRLLGGLSSGATPYSGQLVADMPSLFNQAFSQLSKTYGNYQDLINNTLVGQAGGAPAWSFNPSGVSDRWRQNYAVPVMNTWRETVMPLIAEGFNAVPGMAYSAARGKGIEQAANQFYSESVAPTLFQAQQEELNRQFASGENAASRQLGAVSALSSQPYNQFSQLALASQAMQQANQQPLTAQYNEFLRLASENNPYLNASMQFLGLPTTATVYNPGSTGILQNMMGSAIQGGIQGAAMGLGGMLGVPLGGSGGALGGALGGLAGII